MALRVIALLLACILAVSSAAAQDFVKRSIFEDCDVAKTEFAKLTVDQQASLLDFFARVIALNTQSPSAPEVYAVPPSTQLPGDAKGLSAPRGADLVPGALWQSMDAKRELRAKRCALDLLEAAGILSLATLPSLVTTYSEQPLSDEIAVGVEEVAASIAEVSHISGRTLDAAQLEAIVPHAIGPRPLVARNVIHEFRDAALPYLISMIAVKKQSLAPDLVHYLHLLDTDGSRALGAAIGLIPGLTSDQIQHLIAVLPFPAPRALPTFLTEFITLSANADLTGVFTPLLGRTCVALGGITIDQTQQETVATLPSIRTRGVLTADQAECLIQSSPPLARKVSEMLAQGGSEEQRYAIELCSRGLVGSPVELRNEIYAALRRIAIDTDTPNQLDALRSLAAFPERKMDTFTAAQQLFKKGSRHATPAAWDLLSRELFALLSTLKLAKDSHKIAPAIMQSLGSPEPAQGAITLSKHSTALDPSLLKLALTSPPSKNSLIALDVLAARKDLTHKTVPALIELLKYAEALRVTERVLLAVGKPAVASLRKSLVRLAQAPPRMTALGVLVQLRAATQAEAHLLGSTLSAHSDCSFIGQRGDLVCSLTEYAKEDSDLRNALHSTTARCIGQFTSDSLQRVAECDPALIFDSADAIGALIASDTGAAQRIKPIVQLATRHTTEDQSRSGPLLAQLLLHGPQDIQNQILDAIATSRSAGPDVRKALRSVVERQPTDTETPIRLIRALAHAEDSQYAWREFVKKAIDAASRGSLDRDTAEVIAVMPVEPVLAEVRPALESDSPERLVGAALVGGALGTKAIPLVSRLWHLRTLRSPAIRYTVSLALLQINPLTPDMHEALRKILVNRYFDTAVSMPIAWADTVAVNDLERGSFGTLRKDRLEKLLVLK